MHLLASGLLATLAPTAADPDEPFFDRRVVLERKADGAFAIPKLLVTREGTVLVALQDRTAGDWAAPIEPLLIRSTDGGDTFAEPQLLAPVPDGFYVKPTGIVQDRRTGRIFVFLVRAPLATPEGERIDEVWFYENLQRTRELGRGWSIVTSDDDGATWSEPRDITDQLMVEERWQEWSPVHVGLQLEEGPRAGRLVVPVRVYCPEEDPSEHDLRFQTNGLLVSDDGGATWQPGPHAMPYHGECSIAELPGGVVYVNHRRSAGRGRLRDYSLSVDGGDSFSEHGEHRDLSDQRCHAGLTSFDAGAGEPWLVLTHVPGPRRAGLSASVSRDGGRTWDRMRTIEAGHAAYSSVGVVNDRLVCAYETGANTSRRDLAIARFDRAWLEAPGDEVAHANGIKIGEVASTSAVLWTRLTRRPEASHRVDEWDPERPHWTVESAAGEVRFAYGREGAPLQHTAWTSVDEATDSCHQVTLRGLEPSTRYVVEAQGRAREDARVRSTFEGSFTTAPHEDDGQPLTFVVSTCQDFPRRDEPDRGHRIYRTMLELEPAFFVQTGDTLYYDKPNPFAKDEPTARYKWNRMYALPNQRAFHRSVPSYWLHDDHDLLKNDCWPGQTYGELTWEDGVRIWREEIPQSERPFRRFRWGRHLEIWLPEGREFRSPNKMADGPDKSILGPEQWEWLEASLRASDATFKAYVSATPVVGPDRKSKNDNHANEGFAYEGARLRELLSSVPGCFVLNGDRHWQYHSVDPETGLHEFGSGPASDRHAGGFRMNLQEPWQPFLRIKGGFLSVRVEGDAAVVRHHDVEGTVVHEVTLTAAD